MPSKLLQAALFYCKFCSYLIIQTSMERNQSPHPVRNLDDVKRNDCVQFYYIKQCGSLVTYSIQLFCFSCLKNTYRSLRTKTKCVLTIFAIRDVVQHDIESVFLRLLLFIFNRYCNYSRLWCIHCGDIYYHIFNLRCYGQEEI